ncbi:MAG: exodeoxyribonuclease VII large subunit, partial [Bacteroidota bacterium]|nr:exodeoxyribonuclease VII large subunit [Bacteroidota bacterium]
MKILAQVAVSFHEVYGISLNVKDIDPNFTLGERSLKKQRVITQLKEEGVFSMNRELDLPLVPQRIAVISSPSAAGYEDFMMHLEKNPYNYKFDITLFKALMQGGEAKTSIINALLKAHESIEDFDLLVVIRGGGAQVDLDCFDTYELASHIAQFPIPVVTGIGHERDETVVDLVAHTKMKTPTAVAEFLLGGVRVFDDKLSGLLFRVQDYASAYMKEQNYLLNDLAQNIRFSSKNLLNESKHKISQLQNGLSYIYKSQVKAQANRLENIKERLVSEVRNNIKNEQLNIQNFETNIKLLDPENIFKRGYSVTKINNININKVDSIHQDDIITSETLKWLINSKVNEIDKKGKP